MYVAGGPPGRLGPQKSQTRFGNISDGLTNTIFFGDKHVRAGREGEAGQGDCSIYNGDLIACAERAAGTLVPLALSVTEGNRTQFGSNHPNVVQFAFGDGSVKPIQTSISPAILDLLAMRSDGMAIPNF